MKWHLVVVALAATVCLEAQEPPVPETKPVAPPRPDGESKEPKSQSERTLERAQTMREQIGLGRPVKSHVRVSVRLKNGNKLSGVVKDGQLVERIDGLRFVEAQAQEVGAGIRLWYATGARNYVFVPFTDFNEYVILQRLSQKQLDEIEQNMQMEEARRAEREAAAARAASGKAQGAPEAEGAGDDTTPAPNAEPAAKAAGTDPAAKGKPAAKDAPAAGSAADKAAQDLQRLYFGLLQDYPPAAGWGKAKRDEIAHRLVVIGAKPSDKEQRFVDQFENWQKACAHFAVDPEPKPATDGGAESPRDRRSKRKEK